ncbi:hypothetical protein HISP_11205 [Haloarcula hispanica N601]|uniref:Uncharacterized protein n=3 Tax=Haloarcula hispanica TaxID=51589 RepID=V5TNJ4_HALHI|nr:MULTISPECIES: hypothetical protein [Haloarcula]AEM57788.1 conserved hypothetical protein [Haloarcula hispanica ATCC 33960]AHB66537.1 hypothetical protein HISP_11205 [Haloarcula hispanica N601]AJF24851.1 hypothetical protein SG26_03575 [Haloarcula sp. CBA1115]KAA9406526.1 hypothetical protein Har1131_06775 [Haloarcula sp. CBA1131]KAA9410442.1 hypothetical protein EGO51_11730 [Haloarcula hispanica]
MPSPFENPALRYGIPLVSATVVAAVAFLFLEGTIRYVALGIAALEVVVAPQILKQAAANA